MTCQVCGIDAPTRWVAFYQNIGMLVTRQWSHVEGNLCRRCIGKYFRSYTLTSLFLGWWGVISFCVTPFILLNNVIRYLMALGLPEPGIAAMNTPSTSDSYSVGKHTLRLRVIYATVICAVILGGVVSHYFTTRESGKDARAFDRAKQLDVTTTSHQRPRQRELPRRSRTRRPRQSQPSRGCQQDAS